MIYLFLFLIVLFYIKQEQILHPSCYSALVFSELSNG